MYLDKLLKYENIIQAFSRTNRLAGNDKPHGIVRYYRKPHTMELLIEDAFELYSGNKMYGVFVDKLEKNIKKINKAFEEIKDIFEIAGINNFEKSPNDLDEIKRFALVFEAMERALESAKIQGFKWNKSDYDFYDENKLRNLMKLNINSSNINEFGRFDDLKASVDKTKAKAYFDDLDNTSYPIFKINQKIDESSLL